jgi:hypothetical protein
MIDRRGGTWVVKIISKNNLDYDPADPKTLAMPLEEHDTGLAWEDGDEYDEAKLTVCYEWLRSVRDKYALPNIEELKPVVKAINIENARRAALGATK